MLDGDDIDQQIRSDVAIVGGGFAGAMLAIRLASAATGALRVVIFEPRRKLGAGVAYSTPDPDHRLNGPIDLVRCWARATLSRGTVRMWTTPTKRRPTLPLRPPRGHRRLHERRLLGRLLA